MSDYALSDKQSQLFGYAWFCLTGFGTARLRRNIMIVIIIVDFQDIWQSLSELMKLSTLELLEVI